MRAIGAVSVAALGILMFSTPSAALEIEKMSMAGGLAKVISAAGSCGYQIDDAALERYYETSGLATPEILSYISNLITIAKAGDPPTKNDCTLARTTARSIGILSQ